MYNFNKKNFCYLREEKKYSLSCNETIYMWLQTNKYLHLLHFNTILLFHIFEGSIITATY